MTVAIQRQNRRPKEISDRRRVAYERALAAREGRGKIRSRFREDVGRDPKPLGFYMIIAVSLTLVFFGLVMVLSASSITSFHKGGSPWKLFLEQASMAAVGGLGMFMA
jgi:cell division protein FtsW